MEKQYLFGTDVMDMWDQTWRLVFWSSSWGEETEKGLTGMHEAVGNWFPSPGLFLCLHIILRIPTGKRYPYGPFMQRRMDSPVVSRAGYSSLTSQPWSGVDAVVACLAIAANPVHCIPSVYAIDSLSRRRQIASGGDRISM